MPVIRMLLVGDNVDFVKGLRAWLIKEPDIEIVGIEHTGAAAIERIGDLQPQIVLMDVTMAGMSGFEACRQIRSASDSPTIVLMTFLESETVRREAWAVGADGVVGKGHIAETLLPLVRDLAKVRGETGGGTRRPIESRKEDDSWA